MSMKEDKRIATNPQETKTTNIAAISCFECISYAHDEIWASAEKHYVMGVFFWERDREKERMTGENAVEMWTYLVDGISY